MSSSTSVGPACKDSISRPLGIPPCTFSDQLIPHLSHAHDVCSTGKRRFEAVGNVAAAPIAAWPLFENAEAMIFRYELHPRPRFSFINPAATSMTGYSREELYADPDLILNIVHPEDRHYMEAILRGDLANGGTDSLRWIHRKGNAVWIELQHTLVRDRDGHMCAIEGIAQDVTGRKQLEQQLRQSQKIEALGLLAGGVAHDFNNLLTLIIGYSDLILFENRPVSCNSDSLLQIRKAAEKAAALTMQLLAFGRSQPSRLRVLNVNPVIESSAKMLRRLIGKDIDLVTTLDSGLGSINADVVQLEQVLMNFALNAKGAMPQGGKITIETQNVNVDDAFADGTLVGHRGDHVMIAVTDTGCGMDRATQARIFEPFFTTRAAGKGTGLGLSIVYGIVKEGAGHIRVFSETGRGTRFEILLPRTDQQGEPSEAKEVRSQRLIESARRGNLDRGAETIE